MNTKDREDFEAIYNIPNIGDARDIFKRSLKNEDDYFYGDTQAAWWAWKASRELDKGSLSLSQPTPEKIGTVEDILSIMLELIDNLSILETVGYIDGHRVIRRDDVITVAKHRLERARGVILSSTDAIGKGGV